MRLRQLLVILLLAPWFAGAAAASADPAGSHYYTASTTGELVIDAEGRVAELDLDYRRLGDDAMDAVADVVRGWRFDPVNGADGTPVAVRGRMAIDLLAVHQPGEDGLDIAIRSVRFLATGDGPRDPALPTAIALAPPRYPEANIRAGVGGLVMLSVLLDDAGAVREVASDRVYLHGDGSEGAAALRGHVTRFVNAATQAARGWTFGPDGARFVMVPVRFQPSWFTDERWTRTRVFALATPAWLREARAGETARMVDPAAGPVDERLQLRTPVSDTLVPPSP